MLDDDVLVFPGVWRAVEPTSRLRQLSPQDGSGELAALDAGRGGSRCCDEAVVGGGYV